MAVSPIPNSQVRVINPETGIMEPVWYQFFNDALRVLSENNANIATLLAFYNALPATGWGTVSGALDKSSFNTGVIGHTQLAQEVGALLTDLRTKGIIGS